MRPQKPRPPRAKNRLLAPTRWGVVVLVAVSAAAHGCAATSATSGAADVSDAGAGNGVGDGVGGAGPGVSSGSGGAAAPERELDSAYQAPVATGRLVWIANPSSGHVAYVDATTLVVKTVEAGNAPTTVAAVA